MYPDIVMLTDANRGISCNTLNSFVKYAEKSSFLCKPNKGINLEKGERLQDFRLKVLLQAHSEYVLIMDDDDKLINPLPENVSFNGVDVIFFNFKVDDKKEQSFFDCQPYSIYGSCGIIAKRELAIKAVLYNIQERFVREDIGYFYYLFTHCKTQKIENYSLINKIGSREPKRGDWYKNKYQEEVDTLWRDRIFELRKTDKFIRRYDAIINCK